MVKKADDIINFIKETFGAKEDHISRNKDGTIMHASLRIGNSAVMLSEAKEAMPCMMYIYVEDVDSVYKKALGAGGKSLREPTDEFYGDRSCGVKDSSGNQWWIGTHIEDESPEEMKKREQALKK